MIKNSDARVRIRLLDFIVLSLLGVLLRLLKYAKNLKKSPIFNIFLTSGELVFQHVKFYPLNHFFGVSRKVAFQYPIIVGRLSLKYLSYFFALVFTKIEYFFPFFIFYDSSFKIYPVIVTNKGNYSREILT